MFQGVGDVERQGGEEGEGGAEAEGVDQLLKRCGQAGHRRTGKKKLSNKRIVHVLPENRISRRKKPTGKPPPK